MLHEETVRPETMDLIRRLSADEMLNEFVLVGGTALALQLGHRRSVDIDLFSAGEFDPAEIAAYLQRSYRTEKVTALKNGLFAWVEGIKLDMINLDADWIKPPLFIDGIRMASIDDIAATKLKAIYQSGARVKDFIDMYFLLEYRSLNEMLAAYEMKYPYSSAAVARLALMHHADINFKVDTSVLIRPFDWEKVKARLQLSNQTPKHIFKPEPLRQSPLSEQIVKQKAKKQNRKKL
jgi:hypothetical protein